MLIQVDWYKETGKWAYGERVEVDALGYETREVLLEVIKNQTTIIDGWEKSCYYSVVTSDIPESENDPNYRTIYSRLYSPKAIKELLKNA